MAIVRAKIRPPRLLNSIVDRPHLLARINEIWSMPLGLIVAPAGFGKSTLARSWMATQSRSVGWLTLDPADNDVDRFILYLLEAIASINPRFVANTRSLFDRSSRPSARELAETLADELMDANEDLALVLDEAEHLSTPEAWDVVECLIRLAPPRFHLLVLSRVDPPLPLARLRMREQIVEFRGSDLLLSSDEIDALFTQHGVALSDEGIGELQRATHGWPAGVRLALVQGINAGQDWHFDLAPSRPRAEFVLDPLAAELVDRLPVDISDTLMAASIVDDLNPDLLDALVGKEARSRQLIEEYTRAGILISSAPRGIGWVRLHPLFRDLFRRQLTSRHSRAEINQLHRNAARWFVSAGDLRSAIQHLVAVRDIDDLVQLLNTEIPVAIDQEDWAAVSEWLDAIPEEIIADSPTLALGQCWVLFFKGNWLAMRGARDRLRAQLEAMPEREPRRSEWLAEMAVLEATEVGAFIAHASRLLTMIETASPHLPSNRHYVRGQAVALRAMALEEVGRSDHADAVIEDAIGQGSARVDAAVIRALVARCFVLRQRGDFARLETASSELALIASTYNLPVARGWAQLFYGFVLFQRNDLSRAEIAFSELARDHARVHIAGLREGMMMLARIYWALGDPTESEAVIRRLREILAHQGSVEMLPSVASLERFLSYLDNPHKVTGDQGSMDLHAIINITPHALHHPVTTAILLKSEAGMDGAAQALQLAETFAEQARAIHYQYWQPEILALQSIALSALNRNEEAVEHMRRALRHDITRHLTRTFLDLGYRSHALYRALEDDAEVGALARSLLSAQRQSSQHPDAPAPTGVAPLQAPRPRQRTLLSLLTDRELSVLELLEKRLSYKEIGSSLSISPLTVKRHAGNIYDKLGASSRREAVALAHEMGWEPERQRL